MASQMWPPGFNADTCGLCQSPSSTSPGFVFLFFLFFNNIFNFCQSSTKAKIWGIQDKNLLIRNQEIPDEYLLSKFHLSWGSLLLLPQTNCGPLTYFLILFTPFS